MIVLARMRLVNLLRTGRALASLMAALVVLAVIYGGGKAPVANAYGFSAVVLFPVLTWQSKLLLDAEPDSQRRIAIVSVGSVHRELAAGLLAALLAGVASVGLALVVPWLVGGIAPPRDPADLGFWGGLLVGIWALLVVVPAAVVLGALCSRAVTGSIAHGIAGLGTGVVLTLVLGLKGSVAPWLVPPVMAVARTATGQPTAPAVLGLTGWALAWTGIAAAAYAWIRDRRR